MSKSVFKPIAAVLLTAATATALVVAPRSAKADEQSIDLTPIENSSSPVDYMYLDAPKSVFKDASGFVVAERNTVDYITEEPEGYKVTVSRPLVADKACRYAECLITSKDGAFDFYYGDDRTSFEPSSPAVDFVVSDGTLYILGESSVTTLAFDTESSVFDTATANTTEFVSDEYPNIEATAVTVVNGEIIVAVNSSVFADKQDICTLDRESGVITPAIMQSDKILSLTSLDAQSVVYALTRDKITGYYSADGSLQTRFETAGAGMSKLCAFDGFVYGLSSLNAIVGYSYALDKCDTLTAAASNELGFFDMPSAVAVKNAELFVADTINNRIVKYSKGAPVALDADVGNPVSIACDSGGTLYIAHDINKISVISANGKATELSTRGAVKQVAVDADKTIYALTDRGLFRIKNGETEFEELSDTKFKAITLSVGKHELYALDGDKVIKFTFSGDNKETVERTDIAATDAGAFSIAVDLDGNIYALTRTEIVKTSGNAQTRFTLKVDGEDYSLGFTRGQIAVCTIDNDYVDYGDIVIADAYKHRIFSTDGDALGVMCVGEGYEVPDLASSTDPDLHGELIRTALRDTTVFSKPAETPPVYTIAAGRTVIVPEYQLSDFPEYSFVIIEKLDANGRPVGELVQGYVYRETLSDPIPYADPTDKTATVYKPSTTIYKWPTPNAKALNTYGSPKRNDKLTLMRFVSQYYDDYGNLWYRVLVGDSENSYEGFVIAENISLKGYEPVFIRPQYNAEIIEYNGSTFAQAYSYDEDTKSYVEIVDVTFEVGKKVEVVGAFDTSEQYTKIKYLDPELGTITCYVRTVYLKYKGVDIVPIIAWIVIGITGVLALIIVARVFYIKRKRIAAHPGERT